MKMLIFLPMAHLKSSLFLLHCMKLKNTQIFVQRQITAEEMYCFSVINNWNDKAQNISFFKNKNLNLHHISVKSLT